MIKAADVATYPIVLVEDRYQGVYSGGRWLALSNADEPFGNVSRIAWIMEEGPGAGDVEAATFWSFPPSWIASGNDLDEALTNLLSKRG